MSRPRRRPASPSISIARSATTATSRRASCRPNRATPAARCGRSTIGTSAASPAPASIPRSPASSAPTCRSACPASPPGRRSSSPAAVRASDTAAADLRAVRGRVLIVTDPTGAAALQRHALTPDLVIVERQPGGREDAPLSESLLLGSRAALLIEPSAPIAAFERSAGIRRLARDLPSWGVWPATAVAVALRGGATRLITLGLDGDHRRRRARPHRRPAVGARRPLGARLPRGRRSSRAAPAGGRFRGRTSCRPTRRTAPRCRGTTSAARRCCGPKPSAISCSSRRCCRTRARPWRSPAGPAPARRSAAAICAAPSRCCSCGAPIRASAGRCSARSG